MATITEQLQDAMGNVWVPEADLSAARAECERLRDECESRKEDTAALNGDLERCAAECERLRARVEALEMALRGGPTIVCLCGSTRFYREFQRANYEETMAGRIVLSVGFYWHASQEAHGEQWGCTPEQKVALDELHKRKIDLADEVLILNVGGYVGESTRSEWRYAVEHGKRVRWLEPARALLAADKERGK